MTQQQYVSPFASTDEVVRIDLRPVTGTDDWVEVRATLRYGDTLAIRNAAVQRARRGADGDLDLALAIGALQLERLARAIVRWSLRMHPDDPAPVPVTREAIQALHPRVADYISERLDELYGEAQEGN